MTQQIQKTEPRTAGTSDTCVYANGKDCCDAIGVGEVRHPYMNINGTPWTMCARHIGKKYHSIGMQDKVFRWEVNNGN
jgi:hypothetical protein